MSFLSVIISTAIVMLFAEFADKTSLVAVSLSTKTKRPKTIFIGSVVGIAFTSILSIIVAIAVGNVLPNMITLLAALVFIFLGLSSLFGKARDENAEIVVANHLESKSVFMYSATIVALAEFGDKSQIFLFSRALIDDPLAILIGALIGEGIVLGLSIYFGDKLNDKLKPELIDKIVGTLFLLVGLLLLFQIL